MLENVIPELQDNLGKFSKNTNMLGFVDYNNTLDAFKLLSEPGKKVVVISSHGGYLPKLRSFILTGTKADNIDQLSADEQVGLFLWQGNNPKNRTRFVINQDLIVVANSEFFDNLIDDGDLEGSVIILSACHRVEDMTKGKSDNNTEEDLALNLAESFLKKGASLVIGFDDAFQTEYATKLVADLLQNIDFAEQIATGDFSMIETSLDHPKMFANDCHKVPILCGTKNIFDHGGKHYETNALFYTKSNYGPEATNKVTPVPTATPTPGPSPTPEIDYEQVYAEKLNSIHNTFLTGEMTEELSQEIIFYDTPNFGQEALESYGYAIQDISGDGIPELFIVEVGEVILTKSVGSTLVAVYTAVDNAPSLVLSGWVRNYYTYLGDGKFYNGGINSAWEHAYSLFKIPEDGTTLHCIEHYFSSRKDNSVYSEPGYFNNDSCSFDLANSTEIATQDEFRETTRNLYDTPIRLILTPFSEYTPTSAP